MPALNISSSRAPFLAVVTDEVTRAMMVGVAIKNDWSEDQVLEGSAADAADALAEISTPEKLVIDLSGSIDPVADIDALARVCMADTRVIALGDINDVQLFRHLMDMGVQDYLLKPVSAEDLNAALNRADEVETASPDDDNQLGRLIAVVGARGGVGASTVSANIAWMMAHEQGLRVALIDLDLYFGTLALALDMEPGLGFREALENPSRIDGLFIERAMVRESDNLYILAAEEGLENSFSFDPKALDRLLETLRADFDCVVIDLPRFAARSQISTLIPPASVVVVSDPTLAGMRDTQRLAKLVKTVTPDSELSIVVNRVGNSKNGELTIKDFESGAELSVDHQIPCDVKSAILAEGAGKTVAEIAKATKMSQTLRDLSRNVSGRVEDVVQAPMWKRLMGRG
ncbi:MAG: P-loop NTPase [Rhodospirillaceae bacterium]|nr:P-loop NTPase [Rhodospirillaceae bacterium]MBT5563685.1 P-loop NTPase [Rhodospirillaceae bacterium]MBT6241515.1 P-loop NTPase [Rhodospirillaceae bacterium]MBT7137069.1 P-loop NTPase [Rhodospirillaceae bacterium]